MDLRFTASVDWNLAVKPEAVSILGISPSVARWIDLNHHVESFDLNHHFSQLFYLFFSYFLKKDISTNENVTTKTC